MQGNWLDKIRNHENHPPKEAWVNIANELDKEDTTENLSSKILAYETTPPGNVLNNIFNQLDEEEEQTATPLFVEKLKRHTQTPPLAVWENIISNLDKDEAVVYMPAKKKNTTSIFLRIAAAAAVIAIVWISVVVLNNKNATTDVATSTPKQQQQVLPKIVDTLTSEPAITPQKNQLQQKNVAIAPPKKDITITPLKSTSTDYLKGNEVKDLAQSPSLNKKEKLQNIHGETPMDIAFMNVPNTYISITGADGQSVKVSSKFSNLVGAFSNNSETRENIDVIIDESAKWRPIIEIWRNKMANNSIAPSLSNFMDIIELSKVLEEKK